MIEPDTAGPPVPAAPPAAGAPGLLRSPTAKFLLIGLLTVALTVPLMLVFVLTTEREGRRDEVRAAVARDWGAAQTVSGPMVLVPYTVRAAAENAPAERRTAVFLPDAFEATASMPVESRSVSIFSTTVYTATVRLTARFAPADLRVFQGGPSTAEWTRAVLAIGLGDVGGIEVATVTIDGVDRSVEPGLGVPPVDRAAVHVKLPADLLATGAAPAGGRGFAVVVDLRIRGTESFRIAPSGRQSEIRLASSWPHPGFQVGSLPSERSVGPDGFTAVWRIPYLARQVPQAFTLEDVGPWRLEEDAVGAAFTQPVDHYALVGRSLKYAVMVVATLLGFVFVLELLSPRRIHIVQYGLVGLVLVFFYVLLLALSEQIGFARAYALAAAATTAVIASFVGLALASLVRGLVALAGLSAVFAAIYVILDLEDLALLAGALTGFLVVTLVLFATRRVDWSGSGSGAAGRSVPPPLPRG